MLPAPRRRHLSLASAAALCFIATGTGAALAQEQVPAEMKAQAKALAQICSADFVWFCPGVRPGGGRVLACLQSHASELTAQCHDALPRAEALKAKASEAGVLPK